MRAPLNVWRYSGVSPSAVEPRKTLVLRLLPIVDDSATVRVVKVFNVLSESSFYPAPRSFPFPFLHSIGYEGHRHTYDRPTLTMGKAAKLIFIENNHNNSRRIFTSRYQVLISHRSLSIDQKLISVQTFDFFFVTATTRRSTLRKKNFNKIITSNSQQLLQHLSPANLVISH